MVICNTSGKFVIAATEMYVFFLIFVIGIICINMVRAFSGRDIVITRTRINDIFTNAAGVFVVTAA